MKSKSFMIEYGFILHIRVFKFNEKEHLFLMMYPKRYLVPCVYILCGHSSNNHVSITVEVVCFDQSNECSQYAANCICLIFFVFLVICNKFCFMHCMYHMDNHCCRCFNQ